MNVTPSTIASAVSASRSLWASSPRRVTLRMSRPQGPHLLEDGIGGRCLELTDDAAVVEEDDPVRVRGAARVVRDHDNRLAKLTDRPLEEREEAGGRVG